MQFDSLRIGSCVVCGGVCFCNVLIIKFVMPIAKWGLSSTKSYTDRHYGVYN